MVISTINTRRNFSGEIKSVDDLGNENNFEKITLKIQREGQEKLGCRVVQKGNCLCVTSVEPDAPSFGLVQPGDYIVRINGRGVKSREKLFRYINNNDGPYVQLIVARLKPTKTTAGNSSGELAGRDNSKPITSTNNSDSNAAAIQRATDLGFKIKESKAYLALTVKKTKGKRLGLGIKRTKNHKIMVSRLERDSYAVDVLHVGDRLLAINGRKVTDKEICHRLIIECKGEFEALIERKIADADEEKVNVLKKSEPLNSTYTQPNPWNVEHDLGDPHCSYETAPRDVQEILRNKIPSIVRTFSASVTNPVKKSVITVSSSNVKTVNIDPQVVRNNIPSEIDPNRILRKLH